MLKILMTSHTGCGGSSAVACRLASELALRGHKIHFVASERPFFLDIDHPNVHLHTAENINYPVFKSPPVTLTLASKMIEITNDYNIDLINTHYAIPHAVNAYLTKQATGNRVKVVNTIHNTDVNLVGGHPSLQSITKFALEQSDGITAVSKYIADTIKNDFAINKDVKIINNFINIETFNNSKDRSLREVYAPNNERVLIHVSNFRPFKRVLDVIRIAAKVQSVIPIKLLMVGDGPDKEAAIALAKELGIQEYVHFLGTRSDISHLLQISDIFIFPTANESFSLAVMEAMSNQLPIITTNCAGMPELVRHGVSGFTSQLGDIEDMANNTILLLRDNNLYQKFSTKALAETINNWLPERIIPIYEQYFYNILNHS